MIRGRLNSAEVILKALTNACPEHGNYHVFSVGYIVSTFFDSVMVFQLDTSFTAFYNELITINYNEYTRGYPNYGDN